MSEDDLNSEIILAAGDESARFPDVPRDVLRALHAAVLGKKEIFELLKHRQALIEISDLEQICMLLAQWSAQYDPISRKIEISAIHRGIDSKKARYRYRFSSLESFKRYDQGTKDPIDRIEMHFSMVSSNPETGQLQPLELTLEFTGLYDHPYYMFVGVGSSELKPDSNEISCKIRVEYVDYLICKSLVSVVDDWYDGLDEEEYKPLARWWRFVRFSYRETAIDGNYFCNWVPLPFAAMTAVGLSRNWDPFEFSSSQGFLVYFVFSYFCGSLAFRLVYQYFEGKTYYDTTIPLLRLNKGNERQIKAYRDRKSKAKYARGLLLVGVLLAFVVNVASSWVSNFLL